MIVDGKLEKKYTNGQTCFYIKKLENELSRKTDTSVLVQKSPPPIICRTPSQLTFTETEYHQNEITTLYEKLRELTTEMKAMKSFVIEQILLGKNSVNDKFGNNAHTAYIYSVITLTLRSISPYSVRMRENVNQNNSKYRHFSRSVNCKKSQKRKISNRDSSSKRREQNKKFKY